MKVQINLETLDTALGLLMRKEFSVEEIPALNTVLAECMPIIQGARDEQEKQASEGQDKKD